MDFIEKVKELSVQFDGRKNHVNTEEATKTALVLPFIRMLGYDYHDPNEVTPEFPADVGNRRGEKVDYALFHDCKPPDKPAILIECKSYGVNLDANVSQLLRYFTVEDARFGILTDGIIYRFFSDLNQRYRMDSKPFFEFNMLDFTESQVEKLEQFTKSNFHESRVVDTAYRLKYIKDIRSRLAQERANPSDDFVQFIMRPIYTGGSFTQKVVERFRPIVGEAFSEFVNERIAAARLKSALDPPEPMSPAPDPDPIDRLSGWIPLSQIDSISKGHLRRPTAIKFNNGETRPVQYWKYVLSEVAEWLVRDGRLTAADLPIKGGGRGWEFINSVPNKRGERDFRAPQQISDGIYMEMHHNATYCIRYSKRLLTHCSIEHEVVELNFG